FDLGRDYGEIKKGLAKDEIMKIATKYGGGIRILNQDLWETVVSFIISASNNIPRIKGIIERLCALYGSEIEYMGEIYYSFPDYNTLAGLTREDLAPIRAGYRDKYILDAAQKFADGILSDTYIRSLPTAEAKKELLSVNGIGEKVANCILLFGLQRTESFPVDVWIKRIMEYCYFNGETTIPAVSALAKEKFGDNGGFAQQYLFFYAREEKIDSGKG
ncbi:MAG: DNA-3-methyladenine glycosylase 2 family protein, partial [Clostridia bacterium]|nr:DNA-3-methyladenine glycosylase 2 family protein [Clostridia bacterium]